MGHLPAKEKEAALQEAEVLRQMSHSNIVTCHESFIEGDKLYIVMDYADGGDLAKAIQRRRETARPFSEVVRFLYSPHYFPHLPYITTIILLSFPQIHRR